MFVNGYRKSGRDQLVLAAPTRCELIRTGLWHLSGSDVFR